MNKIYKIIEIKKISLIEILEKKNFHPRNDNVVTPKM